MNALTVLKQDHGNIEELFHRFETCDPGDTEELGRIRDKVIEHLAKHSQLEEQIFYPAIRAKVGDENAFVVFEGLEEHHVVKATLSELEKMAPTHDRFRAKMTVLIESVRHHVEEEEQELFEKAREAFTMEELNDMGDAMESIEPIVPTRAHPLAPDQPPLNILVGLPVAVLDRTITLAKGVVGEVLDRAKRGTKSS
ncbi:MAG TPA: hemerythrin domain-containing protein [Acidimicrobiales bacterium]